MALILIVDDHYPHRRIVKEMLAGEGHQTISIDDATKTPEYIDRVHPDLVLLNGMASEFDAYATLNAIHEKRPKFPVLVYVIKAGDALKKLKQAVALSLLEIRFDRRKRLLFRFDSQHSGRQRAFP